MILFLAILILHNENSDLSNLQRKQIAAIELYQWIYISG